jgi:hypothetical protein
MHLVGHLRYYKSARSNYPDKAYYIWNDSMFELCPSSVLNIRVKFKTYLSRTEYVPVRVQKTVRNTYRFGPEDQSYFKLLGNPRILQ